MLMSLFPPPQPGSVKGALGMGTRAMVRDSAQVRK